MKLAHDGIRNLVANFVCGRAAQSVKSFCDGQSLALHTRVTFTDGLGGEKEVTRGQSRVKTVRCRHGRQKKGQVKVRGW